MITRQQSEAKKTSCFKCSVELFDNNTTIIYCLTKALSGITNIDSSSHILFCEDCFLKAAGKEYELEYPKI